ncbi:hypothetical protein ASD35_02675 [Pelomonas sp. Root1444]|nr:hypothetical protein ASD35_02675 [Pelomonas sp. Root1444]
MRFIGEGLTPLGRVDEGQAQLVFTLAGVDQRDDAATHDANDLTVQRLVRPCRHRKAKAHRANHGKKSDKLNHHFSSER